MDEGCLLKAAVQYTKESKANYISKELAISPELVGMRMYAEPIMGFASAEDEYFTHLKEQGIIGDHYLHPQEWLPRAKTVISLFLPFSKEVKEGNKRDMVWPSPEWLHARIEGQVFINHLSMYLQGKLVNAGYKSVVPSLDERFWTSINDSAKKGVFTSNWSERHAAFICGLGTFGLSKGLITAQGVAGRFGSIITELYLTPSKREYEDLYQYCSYCGKCVKNCPVNAISLRSGKDHAICSEFLDKTAQKFTPRYGCGKCQVNVPCESGIPSRKGSLPMGVYL
ncbi:MAG: 4Fe-4S binding protein [Firmicutes bacterium]|mgnify:CR=1 FL=1|nr:4Fe-4S binding protein [Bacillota bacterium]